MCERAESGLIAQDSHTRGASDVDLLARLAQEDFDGIITRDRKQLVHDDERTALRRAGLHWVGVDRGAVDVQLCPVREARPRDHRTAKGLRSARECSRVERRSVRRPNRRPK
ncbi:hypothetical protein GRS83_01055 [Rathayibacter rathayi NCPPB 2980 = VKM Ac-1601]|nr:hypothetical protein [Rathayibacter rathayi NCPPB 2980 = VKM Ac-1601]